MATVTFSTPLKVQDTIYSITDIHVGKTVGNTWPSYTRHRRSSRPNCQCHSFAPFKLMTPYREGKFKLKIEAINITLKMVREQDEDQ